MSDSDRRRTVKQERARVVLLTNPMAHTMATAESLISGGANLVGVLSSAEKELGLPLPQYLRALKRNGIFVTAHKTLGRLVYGAINARRNRRFYRRAFNLQRTHEMLDEAGVPVFTYGAYSEPAAMEKLTELSPDIIVVHSQSWVPKKVRMLAGSGLVIGGHPGKTPDYRGGHSMFWALYDGKPDDVMWSVFHLDGGVDTGDLISQGPVPLERGDTFEILGWRAMQCIGRAQAEAIAAFDAGQPVVRIPHDHIPENSIYGLPTLAEYVRYRMRQRIAR